MKTLVAACAVIITPVTLLALPNYDPFTNATGAGGTAYAVGNWVSKSDGEVAGTGQKDATGGQWYHAGAAANNTPIITVGNVGYPGLAGGSTNMIVAGNAGATDLASGRYFHSTLNKSLGNGTGAGSRFYSFVMKASDLTGLAATGGTASWLAGFNNTGGASQTGVPTVAGGRTILKSSGGGYQIGLCKGVDAPNFASSTFTTSDSVFIVVEYAVNSASTTDDVVSMWINPSYNTFGTNANKPAATLTQGSASADMANGTGSLQSFLIGNKANLGLYSVDELRVAADWAGVTPAFLLTNPASITVDYGQPAVFNVTVASSATYQWQKNGTDISGETASSLTFASANQTNEGNYTVIATGGNGAVTSLVATLTVNDPKITSGPSPSSQAATPGSTVQFSVTAIGSPVLTYQWKKDGTDVVNGNFGGTIISGANSNVLTIQGVRSGGGGDVGSYTLAVTNGNGRGLISSAAALSAVDPAVTTDPQSQVKNYNDTVTFTATVSGTQPPFTYVWRKNGTPVTVDGVRIVQTNSGTFTSLTIHSLTSADQASTPGYTVLVTDNAAQSTVSLPATLAVVDPIITTPVGAVITNVGSTALLAVQAAGSGSVTYQWKTNGVAIANGATGWGSTVSGATSATLNIAGVTTNDVKTYVVEVSGAGPTQGSTGTLSVVQITMQPTPAARVVATNTRAVFLASAALTGSGSLSYQWRKSSGDVSGATATALSLSNLQVADSDSYYLRVIYGPGSAFLDSSSASLAVSSAALQLQNTNLVVARIGDGLQTLRDGGNSIYLDQLQTSGSYVNTVTIPESGTNSIVARGTASSTINSLGGMTTLTLSADGSYLVLNGYRTNYDESFTAILGSGGGADTSTPRAVTTLDPFSDYRIRAQEVPPTIGNSAFRCAAFDGVDEYWGATGSTTIGVYYFGTQSAPGAVTFNNARIVAFFNGKFYVVSGNTGVYHFDGKPHPGDTLTQDITFSTTGGSGGCDIAISADGNKIYVADGRNWSASVANTTGGVQVWESSNAFAAPTRVLKPDPNSTLGALYLTADFSGANPVVYATTIGASQNSIVKVIDDGSNSGAGTATVLATAGQNQQFRGIRFGPSATPPRPVLSAALPGAGTTSVTVSWSSVSGKTYRLDYKDDLSAALWTPLYTNTASGSTMSYVDTTSPAPANRFYRVVIP